MTTRDIRDARMIDELTLLMFLNFVFFQHEIFNNDQTQELKEIASAMAATVSISEADASKPGREDSSMFSKKSTKSSSSKVSTKSDASKVSMKSSSSKKNKDAAAPSKIEEECGCVNDVVEQVEQRE